MYNKILVPLDGSELSECSLSHLKAIAKGCHVPEVVLLRVVEPLSSNEAAALVEARSDLVSQVEDAKKSEALDYISSTAKGLENEGFSVRGEITLGNAAEEILGYAGKNAIDLIIMSTHGWSGLTRWAFGSVADRVIRNSSVPVMMMAPAGCRHKPA
jgi:nucleotide-binding universal stress UspA family protein